MTMKTCKMAVRASAILAAVALSGGAFAAGSTSDSYSFEGKDAGTALDDAALTGLSGNGTIVADAFTYSGDMGKPISGESANVLEVAGTVTYTNATEFTNASKSSQVDFMFKVEPTDELEAPSGSDVQVAMAVGEANAGGETADVKLWCAVDGTAQWISLKAAATGSWVRATLVLDYAAKRCRVALDGDPVKVAGSATNAWYSFVGGTAAADHVKSITMVGSTRVDDLVITHTAVDSYAAQGAGATVPAGSSGVAVDYAYMNRYGVTKNQVSADATVGGGMKVSEKFVAGLDPNSGTKFALRTMTPVSSTSATVTFPGNNDSGYTVTVTDASGATIGTQVEVTSANDTAAKTDAGETIKAATVTLDPSKLNYIKVKATK